MKAGDVVLVPMPTADGKTKQRPALLLRKMPKYDDWMVCGISSQLWEFQKGLDFLLKKDHPDFKISGLKHDAVVRVGYVAVVTSSGIQGSIGKLNRKTHREILQQLSDFIKS